MSPVYITLIAKYLPVSTRLICDRLLRNGKAREIVNDFTDLVALSLLNRLNHKALRNYPIIIPFPLLSPSLTLLSSGYWKPTELVLTKNQHETHGPLFPFVTDLTLRNWWHNDWKSQGFCHFPRLVSLTIIGILFPCARFTHYQMSLC